MSLDVVNNTSHEETNGLHPCGVIKGGAVFENWREFPYTNVSHHGSTCCEMAREWLYAMDYTQLNGGSPFTGPRWLRQRYNWGPTVYPIHWCEAVEEKTLDCGALASLSREVFKSRNVRAYPAQLVQQFTTHATAQWQKKWSEKEASTHWINDDVIYHEGCAILTKETKSKSGIRAQAGGFVPFRKTVMAACSPSEFVPMTETIFLFFNGAITKSRQIAGKNLKRSNLPPWRNEQLKIYLNKKHFETKCFYFWLRLPLSKRLHLIATKMTGKIS
ncbi:MAG TPA: hypothetical protein VGB02_19135 [Pyrinomonadaceae bacterium]